MTGFAVTPVTFDQTGRATQYEIAITAQITFKRVGTEGKVIWKSDRYTFRENYPVDPTGRGLLRPRERDHRQGLEALRRRRW